MAGLAMRFKSQCTTDSEEFKAGKEFHETRNLGRKVRKAGLARRSMS